MKVRRKIKGGEIVFRRPNIAEKMILLGDVGVSNTDLVNLQNKSEEELQDDPMTLMFMGKLLLKLDDFVSEVNVEHEGKKITKYNKLLDIDAYIPELSEIAQSLIGDGPSKEKKQK